MPGTSAALGYRGGNSGRGDIRLGFSRAIFRRNNHFGFPQQWLTRDITGDGVGLPNHFTWPNAYNPTAPLAWTIRQGFSQTTSSVNPFIASTSADIYVVGSVYDSLYQPNPLFPSQFINWMTSAPSKSRTAV